MEQGPFRSIRFVDLDKYFRKLKQSFERGPIYFESLCLINLSAQGIFIFLSNWLFIIHSALPKAFQYIDNFERFCIS